MSTYQELLLLRQDPMLCEASKPRKFRKFLQGDEDGDENATLHEERKRNVELEDKVRNELRLLHNISMAEIEEDR